MNPFLTSLSSAFLISSLCLMGARASAQASGPLLWSTLGVVADGVTDNTAALNALPTGVAIIGDCPGKKPIMVDSPWIWNSNLNLDIQAGCQIISNVSGYGTYAITQANLFEPLTNVSVTGLQIAKYAAANAERIMILWVNHFTLLHWTVTASGGVMFLRGSDQEIGYGTVTGTYPNVGNPGIRHIGNLPEVPTSPGRPANVYIHDNNIQSGDAAYQACQPLGTDLWTNVSSDDILFSNNVGRSTDSVLLLIGEATTQMPQNFYDWSCNNITVNQMSGAGIDIGVLIGAGSSPNVVSNVSISNLSIDASSSTAPAGAITFETLPGGSIESVSMNQVTVTNTYRIGLEVTGNVSNFSFSNGSIQAPSVGGLPTVYFQDSVSPSVSNSTIGSNAADAIAVGVTDANGLPHTVTNPLISGNTLSGISNNRNGVNLINVSGASVLNNNMQGQAGQTLSIGITFTTANGTLPGTTNSTAEYNNVSAMTHNPTIVFAPNQGNSAINNTGSPNYP